MIRVRAFVPAAVCAASVASPAWADDVPVSPSTLNAAIVAAKPGDTLLLGPGTYKHFTIANKNGSDNAWITIRGPAAGAPERATIEADAGPCCNTIEIIDSSYVAIENLIVDGKSVAGAFGVSAKANFSHHIRIEGNTFLRHDGSQSTVAISTKAPAWAWTIRRNTIIGAGTGMYLGNSNGDAPFIGGLIEGNLTQDTIGYNAEVKWQKPRPSIAGIPTTPQSTIIRHNVWIKTDRPSELGDRPNLLVGGFPTSGAGSEDRYEIYGNFFHHNPREALLQASGRVTIHDNIFVDSGVAAIALMNHDLPIRQAFVYQNTIYDAPVGVRLGATPPQGSALVGNLIFSPTPVNGTFADTRENVVASVADATKYVAQPSKQLGAMDFFPLPGQCLGSPLDLTAFASDAAYDLDFNGLAKGDRRRRGAYAGEGKNPGWKLGAELKATVGEAPGAGGQNGTGNTGDAGDTGSNGATSPTGDSTTPPDAKSGDDGCSAAPGRVRRGHGAAPLLLLLALVATMARRRQVDEDRA